jgi:hypothetical protein
MLFNSLQAFSELPGQMQGRPILYSQAAKKFYRPGALSVAQTIADCESKLVIDQLHIAYLGLRSSVPLNALKILLFTVVIYFLSGLARTAGAFFTNYLFVLITYLVMSAFFRVLGTATRGESADFDFQEVCAHALADLDRLQRCGTIGSAVDLAHGYLRRLHDSRSVRVDITSHCASS